MLLKFQDERRQDQDYDMIERFRGRSRIRPKRYARLVRSDQRRRLQERRPDGKIHEIVSIAGICLHRFDAALSDLLK